MPSEGITNITRSYAGRVVSLPEPPSTFEYASTDLSYQEFSLFSEHDIIRKDPSDTSKPYTWVVDEMAYEYALEYLDSTTTFACCGSRGVTNVGGSLRCIECDAPVSEEEFKRVLR